MNKHTLSSAIHSTWGHAPRQAAVCFCRHLSSLERLAAAGRMQQRPSSCRPGCGASPRPPRHAAPRSSSPLPPSRLPAPAPDRGSSLAPAVAAAPAPPPPPKQYTVPAGTPLVVRMEQTVSAKNNNVGDSFSGALAQSVVVHGVNVLRAGAPVTGSVVASKGQGRFKGDGARA